MKRAVGGALLAVGIGMAMARWRASRAAVSRRNAAAEADRWLVVTVNCPPDRLSSEIDFPEPLVQLGESVEITVRPAPGNRGMELAARLREPMPTGLASVSARLRGGDPRQLIRTALREAKSLIETGEVLYPDEPSPMRSTPAGKILELATRHAGGEGRL
jgi:hypothetical protein